MPNITFQGKLIVTGAIEAVTGLHIGGASAGLEIGGIDNPIIRHPVTRQPYIPGSSLRGKMRGLLDRYYGNDLNKSIRREQPVVRVHECATEKDYCSCAVCQLFGITPGEHRTFSNLMPTRLIVRDAHLLDDVVAETGESERKQVTRGSIRWLEAAKTDLPYTEIKWEAAIDRITSAAVPRQNERVPAGAVFAPMEMAVSFYTNKDASLLPCLFKAMELLEDDYLGGYGSRGAGKVKFRNLNVVLKSHAYYDGTAEPVELGKALDVEQLRSADYVTKILEILGGERDGDV